MIRSHGRGWPVVYIDNEWKYEDTGLPFDDSRPCKRCGRMPTIEGYDACLGEVSGAKSACCGHGAFDKCIIMEEA